LTHVVSAFTLGYLKPQDKLSDHFHHYLRYISIHARFCFKMNRIAMNSYSRR